MNTNHLLISDDGSHTVVSDRFNVSYHSKHGSIQESNTVFIEAGLSYVAQSLKEIHIFEMGFGTGLNAILSYLYCKQNGLKASYIGAEAYPLEVGIYKNLNYSDKLSLSQTEQEFFLSMHKDRSGSFDGFDFKILHEKISDIYYKEAFDLIYYDAFAPSSQEELWTVDMMQKMHDFLKKDGILTTYCAKGQFKRNLKAVGFIVESLPGPIGKREMTRAIKV
jgi:tRNA U34 5-methylaminomethyl-2-thiouridine-forming methyltransferase MnmC